MVFPKHPFSKTFSNPAENNASQDECEWFFACQISTAFHGLSLQKKGIHANFTVFSRFSLVDFPLLSPWFTFSIGPRPAKKRLITCHKKTNLDEGGCGDLGVVEGFA